MHRTLKEETARPAGDNLLVQQQKFDHFRREFNEDRPHEALQMKCPAELYEKSYRRVAAVPLAYPLHDDTRKIDASGHMPLWRRNTHVYVTTSLAGQEVGLREVEDDVWLVTFMDLDLGHVDATQRRFRPITETATPESTSSGSQG